MSHLLACSTASQAPVQPRSLFCVKRKAQKLTVARKPESSAVFKDCVLHPVSLFQFAAVSKESTIQADGSGSAVSRVTRQSVLNELTPVGDSVPACIITSAI